MWKLIITDDQGQHTSVNLVRDEYRLGRAEENPIRLTERNVSRQHSLVKRSRGGFVIQDLGSLCGTVVNGVKIKAQVALGHRDLIQLGDYRVEVVDEALDTQEQGHALVVDGAATSPPTRLPHRLVVLIGPTQGTEFALEGDRYLIGRDEDCDFQIDHGSVSRIHAEVRRLDDEHFEIIDKGSANGLRINGHERPRAVLDGRDVVELGDVVLKYIMKGQVFRVDAVESERIVAMSGTPLTAPIGESRLPLGAPLAAAITGALLIGGALFVVLGGLPPNRDGEAAPTHEALKLAVGLHRKGDVFGAHEEVQKLRRRPEIASAREFAAIESAWADAMMHSATTEAEPKRRDELLGEVIDAVTVPSAKRAAARAQLAQLTAASAETPEEQTAEPPPEEAEAQGAEPRVDSVMDVTTLPEAEAARPFTAKPVVRPTAKKSAKKKPLDVDSEEDDRPSASRTTTPKTAASGL